MQLRGLPRAFCHVSRLHIADLPPRAQVGPTTLARMWLLEKLRQITLAKKST